MKIVDRYKTFYQSCQDQYDIYSGISNQLSALKMGVVASQICLRKCLVCQEEHKNIKRQHVSDVYWWSYEMPHTGLARRIIFTPVL